MSIRSLDASDIVALHDRVEDLTNDMAEVVKMITRLRERVNELERKVREHDNDIDDIRSLER